MIATKLPKTYVMVKFIIGAKHFKILPEQYFDAVSKAFNSVPTRCFVFYKLLVKGEIFNFCHYKTGSSSVLLLASHEGLNTSSNFLYHDDGLYLVDAGNKDLLRSIWGPLIRVLKCCAELGISR